MACPTSTGSGNWSTRWPLPRTVIYPARAVQVLQPQPGHLTGAQFQPQQGQDHRVVPAPGRGAIRRVGAAFERDCQREALVVVATGAGKTRSVITLVELMMRAGWVKRVLSMADRVALVNAAPSQVAVDLLTGPGRNPAEGQALLDWMENHECTWRK